MTETVENMLRQGDRFGRWTVLGERITTERGEKKYLCRCECGTERYVLERSLKYGLSLSCGCLRREKAYEANAYDLAGQRFGELCVMEKAQEHSKRGVSWLCRCSSTWLAL